MKSIALQDAVAMVPDAASLMIGGFMAVGTSERLIEELLRQGKRNLTVIANDTAMPGRGIGKLISAGLISIASHIGLNPETQQQMIAGKIAVDLVPQGTLIERIRAGGFGLGGILTPTSLPFTSLRPVDLMVTELAVIAFPGGRATLVETAPSVSVDDVVANTEAELVAPEKVPEMTL
jgi:acyl CoA:acetate/3-ketoacid CoA transferase alpha subunit